MTSILNLPANYYITMDGLVCFHLLYIDGVYHSAYDTAEEAKKFAREHYNAQQGE